eukprot:scaffold11691_cov76-Skeletonema_marinoi.AAC.2
MANKRAQRISERLSWERFRQGNTRLKRARTEKRSTSGPSIQVTTRIFARLVNWSSRTTSKQQARREQAENQD